MFDDNTHVHLKIKNIKYLVPKKNNKRLTPADCRLMNITYNTTIQVSIIVHIKHAQDTSKNIAFEIPDVNVATIPIMVRSKLCVLYN